MTSKGILVLTLLAAPLLCADQQRSPDALLRRALHFADLYNWVDATPDFAAAEQGFLKAGDNRNALYARLGEIRGTIERRSLPLMSALLETKLETNALLKRDKRLRLFCLVIKGDIDRELDARAARQDWEEVQTLARKIGDVHWENRALAEIGISAFYDRDLQTASKDVGTAVAVAGKIHDLAAQTRYTTALGIAFLKAKMYERALPYFDNALQIAKSVPDSGYPFLTYQSRLEALIGIQQYDSAQQLADEILKQAKLKHRRAPAAQVLPLSSRIALARGNTEKAISELEKAIGVCKVVGLKQMSAEPEAMLAEIYRQQGNLGRAEHYALAAAKSTQASGDKWSIPQRLQTLAELQASRGRYNEADRTYDTAATFIDADLANSSTVLEKTALIKASSSLYSEHFALVASRLRSPVKAYAIVEQVRGRVTTDLLMAGSIDSPKAKETEHAISRLQLQLMSANSVAEVNRLRRQIFIVQESRWITPGVSILKRRAQETIPAQRVRQDLDASTAILEYVLADPQSYCLVITHEGVRIIPLASQSKIDSITTAYLKAVRDKLPAHIEGRELFDALVRPIREAGQKQKLIIICDGQLHLLPFDALEDSLGRYVGDSRIVAYAPSVTSFYLLSHGAAKIPMHPLLAVGGLPYSHAKVRPISISEHDQGSLGDLPYSKQEVLAANSAIVGKNNLLLGATGTESAFKRAAAARYGIVHLAVHGFPDEADPEQASLALLPDGSAGEDGFLHASEIAMMHLDTNLVVLSACDTAVGPIQGEEGIATLSKAFLLAGARAVVSTLWSVDDTSSLFLMERFYARIAAGDSPAVALTEAKRTLIRKFGKAAVPYYWAGFTFEGVLTGAETIN